MRLFLYFALAFQLYNVLESLSSNTSSWEDIANSSVDATEGNLNDAICSPEDVINSKKKFINGLPLQEAFSVVNKLCSAPKASPDISKMNYILKIGDQSISVPLNEPEKLTSQKEFNLKLPLVMVVTGWLTNFNKSNRANSSLDVIYDAYRCRGNVNFVVVDTSDYLATLYTWSAVNTEEIGNLIATSLKYLVESYPVENIHLIGHSLGAHIVGSAGRNFYHKTDKLIPRITGLDPAKPCFSSGDGLRRLGRGDAKFVDVIHSNPGILGLRDPIGDADFFPNGIKPIPPGCLEIVCAHRRAPEFYAESVYPGNEFNFLGFKCTSLSALDHKLCPGKGYPMGYAVPRDLEGSYFLRTNAKKPFGMNAKTSSKPICKGS